MNKLKPKRYGAQKSNPFLKDHGVVAIVEMNILSRSSHSVTL